MLNSKKYIYSIPVLYRIKCVNMDRNRLLIWKDVYNYTAVYTDQTVGSTHTNQTGELTHTNTHTIR